MARNKNEDETPQTAGNAGGDASGGGVLDTIAEAAAGALETVAVAVGKGAAKVTNAIGVGDAAPAAPAERVHKRAEKIGVVSSDKMTKTVTVRVDRLVKHPTYRKYVKRRKKFMAHDEMGAKTGDKVRIVETRPMSARKRWRVVEIIHKAEL
jgi:small subunit ribosomal protein S17